MSKELATIETKMKAIEFTSDELSFIKDKYAPNSTDMEFKEFIALSQMYGANPLKKQIYFIKYGNQTASFVFDYKFKLQKARKAGTIKGFTDLTWYDKDGKAFKVWPHDATKTPPYFGQIKVFINGCAEPVEVSLYWSERFKNQAEWKNQPLHMMEKCLISKAADLYEESVAGMNIYEEIVETPHGQWVPGSGTNEDFKKHINDKARAIDDRNRARAGDIEPLDNKLLNFDHPDIKRLNKDLKTILRDMGYTKAADYRGKINEVLKALERPTIDKMADMDYQTGNAVLDALRAEFEAIQNGDFGPDDPLFSGPPASESDQNESDNASEEEGA